uniref:Homeobox A10 n=1 Tax=Sciurus vulgaris TaxID=55149 RepID=A0A8D2CVA6_SCIVU
MAHFRSMSKPPGSREPQRDSWPLFASDSKSSTVHYFTCAAPLRIKRGGLRIRSSWCNLEQRAFARPRWRRRVEKPLGSDFRNVSRQFQRRKRSQLAHCKERPEEALPVHQAPDAGAGEGVSLQHVPYSRAAPRDQPQRPPHGQTSENLVSEPQDETEENEPRKSDPGAHSQL